MGMPMGEGLFQELMRRRSAANKEMGFPDGGVSDEEFDRMDFGTLDEMGPEVGTQMANEARMLNDTARNTQLEEQNAAEQGQLPNFLPPGLSQLIGKYSVLNQGPPPMPPKG